MKKKKKKKKKNLDYTLLYEIFRLFMKVIQIILSLVSYLPLIDVTVSIGPSLCYVTWSESVAGTECWFSLLIYAIN